MKTFMFPGQGSQSKEMGGTLFDEYQELTEKADKILGYSIKELCLEDPRRELNKTQFTQPALYVVNALSYIKEVEESGHKPDFLVGHSLGEFNALLAAECFDFEAGLKLVKKRGELMSQATDGGMAAILNATKEADSSFDDQQNALEVQTDNVGDIEETSNNASQKKPIEEGADEIPELFTKAGKKVNAWNIKYPIGTKVKSTLMDYDDLETRTQVVVLFGHRAAVYMKEYNGYFDLDEIKPL